MSNEKRYIIRLKKDANKERMRKRIKKLRSGKKEKQARLSHRENFIIADEKDKDELLSSPDVAYVEEDQEVELFTVPDDTLYSSQWNLKNTGQFSGVAGCDMGGMEATWTLEQGESTVIVGVCDTGIDLEHEDLVDNLWDNPSPTYGDDHGVRGEDGALTGECEDFNGHGTHVAGIIAAKGNNTQGVAGVAWNVRLMSLRFFNTDGGMLSDAINVIEYGVDNGCDIINHSWGTSVYSDALADAWADANTAGVVMVCAAGNEGKNNDVWPKYPASIATSNNVSVAAFTNTGTNSYFTNHGIKSVHLAAPGGSVTGEDDTNILSTWLDDDYIAIAGTSMAAPHISGALALLKSYYAGWTVANAMTLLEACITPTSDQFMTTEFGGRINVSNLLRYSTTSGTSISLDGPTDITITPDASDPTENDITWTDPTGALFAKTYVHRLEGSYPDDVDVEQVEVYSGDAEACTDTGLEEGVVYGYRFQASYSDGTLSLPVYLRSRGGGEKFACPVPPSGFDFICDYWDEAWAESNESIALDDVAMPVQCWRATMSKVRTREEDATFPSGIVGFYRTVKPDTAVVPTVNDWHLDPVPGTDELMSFQTIKEGAIFLENLVRQVKGILKPIELYSTRLSADKWFVWLDYALYVSDGTIRKYNPPAELFEWDWEDFKLRDNWYDIYDTVQDILNNCRVLYTADPPYTTKLTELSLETAYSETITAGEFDVERTFYYPFWEDPAPTEAQGNPPSPPLIAPANEICNFSGVGTVYSSSLYGEPHYSISSDILDDDVDEIRNIDMVLPLLLPLHILQLAERPYASEAWIYCENTSSDPVTRSGELEYKYYEDDKHITLDWTIPSFTPVAINTPTTDGIVSSASFNEEPESDDPEDLGSNTMELITNHIEESYTYNNLAGYVNKQNRNAPHTKGRLMLSPSWDWEAYPVNFKIVLEIQADGSFTPDTSTNVGDLTVSPQDNEDGWVTFSYDSWDTVWDDEGDYEIVEQTDSIDLNATRLYRLFKNEKKVIELGELYIDNDDELEWDFELVSSLATDTLPDLWKTKLYEGSTSGVLKWWTKLWKVVGTTLWTWTDADGGQTPESITHENVYTLGRWGSISVEMKVVSDFNYFDYTDGVPAHKVPNLIGMTADEDDDDIVPFVDDYITAWNADADNPEIEEGLVNAQTHWDAPESRIIAQSPPPDTILPYGEHDTGTELPISFTVSSGAPSKDIDVAEGYDIPKVTGMTIADAVTFLAANYPTWDIDTDYTTEHYSVNVAEDLIVAQSPDWKIRTIVFDKTIAVSVSLGTPEGKAVPDLRGETLTDAQTALDAINCDCPSGYQVEQYHPTVAEGSVIAQIPSSLPYRLVPEEETDIGLVVSLGVSSDGLYNTPVPLVIGRMIDDDYIDDLETAGWDVVQVPVYCEGETGLIVDQIPRYCATMGELDTNRVVVAVSAETKALAVEGSESGVKL